MTHERLPLCPPSPALSHSLSIAMFELLAALIQCVTSPHTLAAALSCPSRRCITIWVWAWPGIHSCYSLLKPTRAYHPSTIHVACIDVRQLHCPKPPDRPSPRPSLVAHCLSCDLAGPRYRCPAAARLPYAIVPLPATTAVAAIVASCLCSSDRMMCGI